MCSSLHQLFTPAEATTCSRDGEEVHYGLVNPSLQESEMGTYEGNSEEENNPRARMLQGVRVADLCRKMQTRMLEKDLLGVEGRSWSLLSRVHAWVAPYRLLVVVRTASGVCL